MVYKNVTLAIFLPPKVYLINVLNKNKIPVGFFPLIMDSSGFSPSLCKELGYYRPLKPEDSLDAVWQIKYEKIYGFWKMTLSIVFVHR